MGKYDFTSLPNRLGHHTYKWKEAETDSEVLPAWIADMDFVVLPEIRQAVQTYADQLVYGYTYASEELIKEVQKWEATQHGYHFDKEGSCLYGVWSQPSQQLSKPSQKKARRF